MKKLNRTALVMTTLISGLSLSSVSQAYSVSDMSYDGKQQLSSMVEKVREKGRLDLAITSSVPFFKILNLGSISAVSESANGVLGADDWRVWSNLVASRGLDKSVCRILRDRYYSDIKLNRSKYNRADSYHISRFYKATCQ